MYLNREIEGFLEDETVDYIGYAGLENYEDQLAQFGGNIVKGYKHGISIGLVLPDSIVDHLADRSDPNIACEYKFHSYDVLNERLNLIASKLASFLNRKGHRTLPIVAAEQTNEEEATPTVSHKMIAHIAGMGWIGKNCLLITPEHGPRVRFVSLLTNAPLKSNDNPMEQRCNDCRECMKICPVHAIKGNNYQADKGREDRLDFKKCRDYFIELRGKSKWAVCGMCLYICPHGRRK
jgi:epoxyqueuosine reductase